MSRPLLTNRSPRNENSWTLEEDIILFAMRINLRCSWDAISEKLPRPRTNAGIKARYWTVRGLSREWSEECDEAFSILYAIAGLVLTPLLTPRSLMGISYLKNLRDCRIRDLIWGKCAAELAMSVDEVEAEHKRLCGQWKAGEDYSGEVQLAYERWSLPFSKFNRLDNNVACTYRNWEEMWKPIAQRMGVPVEACDHFWTCIKSQGLNSWNYLYQKYLDEQGIVTRALYSL